MALCQETLLACDRGRADLRELRFGPHTCEEGIRVHRRIGAIVSLYCSFQELESRVGLAAVREVRSKEISHCRQSDYKEMQESSYERGNCVQIICAIQGVHPKQLGPS